MKQIAIGRDHADEQEAERRRSFEGSGDPDRGGGDHRGGGIFFLVPSHTSVSSISGLGIVLSNFVPLPLSTITMILNVVLLLIGFLTCGREFGAKTVYTSVMLPVFLGLFERLFPDLHH